MNPKALGAVAVVLAMIAALVAAPDAAATAAADLSVAQVATPGTGTLKDTVSVTNNGPNAAGAVRLTELIAGTGITDVSIASNNGRTVCAPTTVPSGSNAAYRCTLPQILSGRVWNVAFTISAPTGTPLKLRAAAKGTAADPVSANNVSVVSSWSGPVADIAVKVVSTQGDSTGITAVVTVANLGPDTAPGVEVKTTAGSITSPPIIGCPENALATKCLLLNLPSGAKARLKISYVPPRTGTAGEVKIITETGFFDPVSTNNTAVLPGM